MEPKNKKASILLEKIKGMFDKDIELPEVHEYFEFSKYVDCELECFKKTLLSNLIDNRDN